MSKSVKEAHDALTDALARSVAQELCELFDAVEASRLAIRSTYLQQRDALSIYVRTFGRGLGSSRYMESMGNAALLMSNRVLVISNIELQPGLCGKGLLGQLVQEIQRSVQGLDVIEFECVNNVGLEASLIRQGYQFRDSNFSVGRSLYKRQTETPLDNQAAQFLTA